MDEFVDSTVKKGGSAVQAPQRAASITDWEKRSIAKPRASRLIVEAEVESLCIVDDADLQAIQKADTTKNVD